MADKRKTSLLMGLLFLCIGAALMIGSVLIHRSDTAFFASATQITATVTDKHRVIRAHKRDHMYVTYAFDPGSAVVEGSERWSGPTEAFRALSEGDDILVAFIPADDPTRIKSRLITGGRQDFLTPMLLIGGFFAAVGGLLTWKSRRGG
jgi:hypothetical protein